MTNLIRWPFVTERRWQPNDDIVILRAQSHLVQRITEAAGREYQSMSAFVRRALARELQRSEAEFGTGPEPSK